MAINKNKVMEAAQKHVAKGNVDKAIREYMKIVDADPKDVRVWLKIGDLYAKKGAKKEATETYFKVAEFYAEQGFYLKGIAVYKQILKIDPRLVDVNRKLAELYRQLGLLSDAMQQYELVAAFYHREGQTREAIDTIRELVDLDPDNVATRIKLAELYSKENMTVEAAEEFRLAADYLRQHNRMEDFIKVAERLVWHKPDDYDVLRELATLYLKRNDARRALQKLQACFKADPRDVTTLELLAQSFQALDQSHKTISVWKELARIHKDAGRQADADDVWRRILSLSPDDADARAALGSVAPAPVPAAEKSSRVAIPIEEAPPEPPPPRPSEPVRPRSTGAQRIVDPISAPPMASHRQPTGSIPLVRDPFIPPDDMSEDIPVTEEPDEVVLEAAVDIGEVHSDEIAKILTETDVYTKYGLHQKAVEHLKRIFELDPQNVEAHEKLKDIYLQTDRHGEAVAELLQLVEICGPSQGDLAAAYLGEIFQIDPGNAQAAALNERFRLGVAPGASPEAGGLDAYDALEMDPEVEFDDVSIELSDGGAGASVAEVDVDEALEFDVADISAPPPSAESLDEIDDLSAGTMEVAPDQLAEEIPLEADSPADDLSLDDELVTGSELGAGLGDFEAEPPSEPGEELSLADAVEIGAPGDFELDGGYGDDVVTAEPPAPPPDLEMPAELSGPVSMDAALEEFDVVGGPTEGADEFALDPHDAALDESLGGTTTEGDAYVEPPPTEEAAGAAGTDGGTSLEDDLDEADFFISQGLFSEARNILGELLGRYPNHPLILAKLQDVDAMDPQGTATAVEDLPPPTGDDAAEEPVLEEPAEPPAPPAKSRGPSVIAKPLGEADADTHFDLGLAYKEMGLFDEAIKEFSLVMETPGREVQCYKMIGHCHTGMGNFSDAVSAFKKGLYVEDITEQESLDLYFEIGLCYEALSDVKEALYYFEKVAKRDPSFRDANRKAEELQRKVGGQNGTPGLETSEDDVDNAFDGLVDGGETTAT